MLFTAYHASSQNISPSDSTKSKKQSNPPVADSSAKYGYAKIMLLGHERTVPLPALKDSDGDGVPDQFDLEPNTPPGVAVDTHGRALDTDGDGVPDYKDKEKLTPQSCYPVDSNGVGKCWEVAWNKKMDDDSDELCCGPRPVCRINSLPSIKFEKGSSLIDPDAIGLLKDAAIELKANPACNIKIVGYNGNALTEKAQLLSWDRVFNVIKYLVEKEGLSEMRFIFVYGQQGSSNTVDLMPTMETGANYVPRPSSGHQ